MENKQNDLNEAAEGALQMTTWFNSTPAQSSFAH